jgi:glycosyltransferase involved in cell wall biosynthesis
MAASGVFVSPSHVEGQPIAILEAMSAGLPVVVTDTGANADVVRDGIDGFVVEVGDVDAMSGALSELVSSSDLRARMGSAALERARKRFDMPMLRARISALYSDVLEGLR